jgi:cell division protein FtsB
MTPPRPDQRSRTGILSGVQIMFAAILAVGLSATITFTSRIAEGQPLQEAYNRVQQEIDDLQQEQQALIAERDYVRSDAYVERWARGDGKMIRPGEVLVVPVPVNLPGEGSETPSVVVVPVETVPPEPESWRLWWALFFDSAPPDFTP